jgi:hypothetical protein
VKPTAYTVACGNVRRACNAATVPVDSSLSGLHRPFQTSMTGQAYLVVMKWAMRTCDESGANGGANDCCETGAQAVSVV